MCLYYTDQTEVVENQPLSCSKVILLTSALLGAFKLHDNNVCIYLLSYV